MPKHVGSSTAGEALHCRANLVCHRRRETETPGEEPPPRRQLPKRTGLSICRFLLSAGCRGQDDEDHTFFEVSLNEPLRACDLFMPGSRVATPWMRLLLGMDGRHGLLGPAALHVEPIRIGGLELVAVDLVAREGLQLTALGLLVAEVDREQGALTADLAGSRVGLAHGATVHRLDRSFVSPSSKSSEADTCPTSDAG
jgi:hypothetical protein